MPDPEFIKRIVDARKDAEGDVSHLYLCRKCGRDLVAGGERRIRICTWCVLEAKRTVRIVGKARYGFKKAR